MFRKADTISRMSERSKRRGSKLAFDDESGPQVVREARFRATVEAAPTAMVMIDTEGSIVLANAEAHRLFGYGPEELLGQAIEVLVPARVRAGHPQLRSAFFAHPEARRMGAGRDLAGVRKDGSEFPIEIGLNPMETDEGTFVLSAIVDITDRKRTEAVLNEARMEAEAATRAKADFLANMSHEIRTPMSGVIGMLDLLKSSDLNGQQREDVELAESSAAMLLTVINDILDFSKIEAGKLELEAIEFDLPATVEQATLAQASHAHSKGIELNCYVPATLPTALRGDPVRLGQVLTNLLNNAVKFTEAGEVNLEVKAGDPPANDGVSLLFEVRDTGIGIAPETQRTLFSPFTQADQSTTRTFGGTGLGLSISRQLVELMGGEIHLESTLGQGSTFTVAVSFERGVPQAAQRSGVLEGLHVLVVDDSPTNRRILSEYLRGWEIRCDTASDGEQALEMLREAATGGEPYSVMILDHHMPKMTGIELMRIVRADATLADATLADTPIVMTSSIGDRAATERDVSPDAFLVKPVSRSKLHDILRSLAGPPEAWSTESSPARAMDSIRPDLRGRVLLVDDMRPNRVLAARMLEKLGLSVEVAEDGPTAVQLVAQRDFDAVLMDCQMPGMDGFDTTRTIRKQEQAIQAARVPIIALTASAMKGDRELCLAAGMDDYLTKPYGSAGLRKVLAAWLLREVPASGDVTPRIGPIQSRRDPTE